MSDIDTHCQQLAKDISAARNGGKVICKGQMIEAEVRKSFDLYFTQDKQLEYINQFVESLGLQPLQTSYWDILNKPQAHKLLTTVLHTDMAYKSEVMSDENADKFAQEYLGRFDEINTLYVSNGMYYGGTNSSWSGITDATFDTGVILLDREKVAVLWFEDED